MSKLIFIFGLAAITYIGADASHRLYLNRQRMIQRVDMIHCYQYRKDWETC